MTVTLEEAKAIARKEAFHNLRYFLKDDTTPLLSEQFLQEDGCWMFFSNKNIVLPPDRELTWGWAYAVSKKGNLRSIADFSDEPEKLQAYLQTLSDNFERQAE